MANSALDSFVEALIAQNLAEDRPALQAQYDSLRAYERAYEQMQERLRFMKAVSIFASALTERLNNHNTQIEGYAEFILEGHKEDTPHDSGTAKSVNYVLQGSFNIGSLTNRLIQLCREMTSFSLLEPAPSALDQSTICNLFSQSCATEGIALKTSAAEGSNIHTTAYISDLAALLMEIRDNAISALSRRPAGYDKQISISVSRYESPQDPADYKPDCTIFLPPGKYAYIVVADNGVGMPPNVLEKAFYPGFSTESTTSPATKSAPPKAIRGLGLTIARHIALYCGGDIMLESEQGKGTTANIYLPLVQSPKL